MDEGDISFSDKFICTLDDKNIDCFTIHLYRNPYTNIGWDCLLRVYKYNEMIAFGLSLGFGFGVGVGFIQQKLRTLF